MHLLEAGGRDVPAGKPLIDTLERMGCGGVVLDEGGQVLLTNPTAERILEEDIGRAGARVEQSEWLRTAIKKLMRQASTRFTLDQDAWVRVPREDKRDVVLHAVPVGHSGARRTVLIFVDLSFNPEPRPEVLEKMFGLTPAEARAAIQITRGDTPADIARGGGVSIATVRSQLASVFAKTQTGRQAELVALLARVSILP